MEDLEQQLRRELREWVEENPLAWDESIRDVISELAEKASPEEPDAVARLKDRLWDEWGEIEAERATRFGT